MSINERLIFDVGACEGNDTDFYLRKGFDVIAVEASPATASGLSERFRHEIETRRLHLFNRAVSNVSGEDLEVWETKDPEHSTAGINPHRVSSSCLVKTISWPELIGVAGIPHYCKIDVEGAEANLLHSIEKGSELPTFMSVESHTSEAIACLFNLGYRRFKLINQALLHCAEVPNPPLEGTFVPDTNHLQGSGLFGRELPGAEWFDFDTFMRLFDHAQTLRKHPEIMRAWFDCHVWMPAS